MQDPSLSPHIGRVVRIKKGRDAGQYAIIVGQLNDHMILVADGEKRLFSRPKKKNITHVHLCSYVSPEVKNSMIETGRVTNGKLRYALYKFRLDYLTEEKGDEKDGERRCH